MASSNSTNLLKSIIICLSLTLILVGVGGQNSTITQQENSSQTSPTTQETTTSTSDPTTTSPPSSKVPLMTTTPPEQPSLDSDAEAEQKFQHLQEKTLKIIENGDQLSWLQLPEGYSKQVLPPPLDGHKPPRVAIFINIRGINSIDMKTEKITLDLDLYEFWADPRFHANHTFDNSSSSKKFKNAEEPLLVEIQKLHPDFVDHIWLPDLFMENCVIVPHNDLTSQSLVSFNTETGFVKYTRLEVTSPCPMGFFYYPLDTQKCEITLRSYKHFSDQLELHWLHITGVYLDREAGQNPNFAIKVDSASKERRISKSINLPNLLDKIHFGNVIWADKSFDLLKLVISFRRNVSFHISQTYLPSAFFIAITWLCFFLPPGMAASRVGITMTTLLTINTMFNSVREHSPQVTYAKAIDVWMGACIFFTFLSLLEFTFMSWLEHVKEREESRKKEHEAEINKAAENVTTMGGIAAELCELKKTSDGDSEDKLRSEFATMISHPRSSIKMMDPIRLRRVLAIRKCLKRHGLTILSMSFVLFNAGYWTWICAGSEYFGWTLDSRFNE